MDFFMEPVREAILYHVEIIIHLETEPERCGISKIDGQAQCGICRYTSLPMDDFIDSARRDPEISAKLVLADSHWSKEFFVQNRSWVYWCYFFHLFTSMVVHNFNTVCVSIFPLKTDSPPLINPNTVLSFPLTR